MCELKSSIETLKLQNFLLNSVIDELIANLSDAIDPKVSKRLERRIEEARSVK